MRARARLRGCSDSNVRQQASRVRQFEGGLPNLGMATALPKPETKPIPPGLPRAAHSSGMRRLGAGQEFHRPSQQQDPPPSCAGHPSPYPPNALSQLQGVQHCAAIRQN